MKQFRHWQLYAILALILLFTLLGQCYAQTANCDSIARAERAYRQDIAKKAVKLADDLRDDVATANNRITSLTGDLNQANKEKSDLKQENGQLRAALNDCQKEKPKQPTKAGKVVRKARDVLAVVGGVAVAVGAALVYALR